MKNTIAKAFYDKTVEVMKKVTSTDIEGGVISKGLEVVDTFDGNVSFSNCKQIQEEYGLDYQIDIAITTFVDTNININDIIQYDSVVYNVTDVLPCDSHILVVATKWRQ